MVNIALYAIVWFQIDSDGSNTNYENSQQILLGTESKHCKEFEELRLKRMNKEKEKLLKYVTVLKSIKSGDAKLLEEFLNNM